MTRSTHPGFRRRKDLQGVSSLIDSTLKSLGLKEKALSYAAFPLWPDIVGWEIARVAVPEKIVRRRIMVVRVLDSAWAQELSFKKGELLEKIRAANLGAMIEDIRFVTGDPAAVRRS